MNSLALTAAWHRAAESDGGFGASLMDDQEEHQRVTDACSSAASANSAARE